MTSQPTRHFGISEHTFQKYVLDAMKGHPNIMLFRRNTGAMKTSADSQGRSRFVRFAEPGQSDLWGVVKQCRCPLCGKMQYGVHIEIELKCNTGKMTLLQKNWLLKCNEWNCVAFVLFPNGNEPFAIDKRIERIVASIACPECSAYRGNKEKVDRKKRTVHTGKPVDEHVFFGHSLEDEV